MKRKELWHLYRFKEDDQERMAMKMVSTRCVGPEYEPLREFIGTFFGRWKIGMQNWNDSPVDPVDVAVQVQILIAWAEERSKAGYVFKDNSRRPIGYNSCIKKAPGAPDTVKTTGKKIPVNTVGHVVDVDDSGVDFSAGRQLGIEFTTGGVRTYVGVSVVVWTLCEGERKEGELTIALMKKLANQLATGVR